VVDNEHIPGMLEAIEESLARHPSFGDSAYIFRQLQLWMQYRLEIIGRQLPAARRLHDIFADRGSDALYHVSGDTTVRCATIQAHTQIETGTAGGLPLEDCNSIFAAAADRIEAGQIGTPLDDGSLVRIGDAPYHGWIWSDEHPDDVFGRSFRFLLKERYHALPRTPAADEVGLLKKGVALLHELLPVLTPTVLCHAHVIGCVPSMGGWENVASSSQYHLGGTIFLGERIQSPWWVAEHVLHEALHQKLYDFRQAHSMVNLDLPPTDFARIDSPWNEDKLRQSNSWDVHRVYAAFHVYVHLGLLALVAERRAGDLEAKYGPFGPMTRSRKALERAHYLGEQLRERSWDQLGPAGKMMAEWLLSTTDFLDLSPPPKGANIHLFLDRYERQSNVIAATLRDRGADAETLGKALEPLANRELAAACEILGQVGAAEETSRVERAAAEAHADESLGQALPELRRIIGAAFRSASLDGYRLDEDGVCDELLREMVVRSTRDVFCVMGGYPLAVGEAKTRANALQFRMSCTDEVGRLLAVLSGAVAQGGRILEIGTGVGVGTAWMVAGLNGRRDVNLVSLEIDSVLSDAARSLALPDHVEILTADALEALPALGMFTFIFADAAAVKYQNIDLVLQALRPGGLLLIDDLTATPDASEQQGAEKSELRRRLLNNPELCAVEMDWASGLVLTSKVGHFA
jgi:predicted O-methyltransferase YrrM